ncbi:hypothetical protein BDY19DRAFT_928776 [Irpex rosettiformis]|uniref:Uncharacterized protein n=1 Tax=Irpex rosettiformis TaxID=378272 RepID=A0ACB8UD27_9APHY|nr:hypothetical protein BDY19DRAFT_928776 [Irpex rosettiformis]
MHVILGGTVLLYFTHTCFRLLADKKVQKPVVSVLLVIILAHIGFGIAAVVHASKIQSASEVNADRKSNKIPWFTTQVAADISVSVTLCLSLPTPSYNQSRGVVQTIILYAISRGILTVAAALVQLIQILIDPENLRTLAAEGIIPWVYANSLLAAINSRKQLRRRLGTDVDTPSQPPISVMEFYRQGTILDGSNDTATGAAPVKMETLEMDVFAPSDVTV